MPTFDLTLGHFDFVTNSNRAIFNFSTHIFLYLESTLTSDFLRQSTLGNELLFSKRTKENTDRNIFLKWFKKVVLCNELVPRLDFPVLETQRNLKKRSFRPFLRRNVYLD